MSELALIETTDAQSPLDWRAIAAGAVVAAGVSITLLAFGSGVGLSLASTAPTWRDSSPWLWILSGLFLIFVALCSFGFGGYVTGRMRARYSLSTEGEGEFRDGVHGVLTWGLAILFTTLLALGGAASASRAISPSSAAQSVAGETIIAPELDELFRGDRILANANIEYSRAEAARVLLKSSGHHPISGDDRSYLAGLVSTRTGIAIPEAIARVDRIVGEAADEIHKARQAVVMQAFLIGAALLIGVAVAWYAAVEGGLERDLGRVPAWSRTTRRVRHN